MAISADTVRTASNKLARLSQLDGCIRRLGLVSSGRMEFEDRVSGGEEAISVEAARLANTLTIEADEIRQWLNENGIDPPSA